ncbi:hypothetical protein GJ496_009045 [Pomphorhynchus laevis]|nr:hypothetical protein GJ496_009045 [Pomphorhynchus laevis]
MFKDIYPFILLSTVAIIHSVSIENKCRSSLGVVPYDTPMVSIDNCTVCYCKNNTGLECSLCYQGKGIPSGLCQTSVGLFRIGVKFTLPDNCTRCICTDQTKVICTGCSPQEGIPINYDTGLVRALRRRLIHMHVSVVKAYISFKKDMSAITHRLQRIVNIPQNS